VAAYLSGEEPTEALKSTRKRPRYPSEDKRSKATYSLAPETIDKVREVARLMSYAGGRWRAILAEKG
jgi:hypothetical protein